MTYERQKHNNKRFFLPGPKEARTLVLFGVSILPNVDSAGRLLSSVEDFLGSESLLVLWIVIVRGNDLSVIAVMAGIAISQFSNTYHREAENDMLYIYIYIYTSWPMVGL